mmetsp:Transcript_13236/g.30814  ORF Transcript_13236/g.30814 Transcript_13236/m.30814 type:complete len:136 (-) Transcript_13236:334-741(-)
MMELTIANVPFGAGEEFHCFTGGGGDSQTSRPSNIVVVKQLSPVGSHECHVGSPGSFVIATKTNISCVQTWARSFSCHLSPCHRGPTKVLANTDQQIPRQVVFSKGCCKRVESLQPKTRDLCPRQSNHMDLVVDL